MKVTKSNETKDINSEETHGKENEWLSPGKSSCCRTPVRYQLAFEHVSLVQNSRFSVLAKEQEEEVNEHSDEEKEE